MKNNFLLFILSILIIYSCAERDANINLNWHELTGDYTGEFFCEIKGRTKESWFVVDRKVNLSQISPNTFNLVFRDSVYNAVAYHLRTRNPYSDTVLIKQINLESLDLQFFEVENYVEPEKGTLRGNLRISGEDYEEYSAVVGIKYFDNVEHNESIHLILERFLPVGAEFPDSTESISFSAYRE